LRLVGRFSVTDLIGSHSPWLPSCRLVNSAVVFLRKRSGQVKFVEQGYVEDLLMWWNDGCGVLEFRVRFARRMN